MASLKEIEKLVQQAEDTIIAGHSEDAKIYWSRIKDAIQKCDELTREERSDLVVNTQYHLDQLDLQTTREERIKSIDELRERKRPPNPPVTWLLG